MRFRRRTVIREREVTVTEEAHDDPPWVQAPAVTWTARYDPGPLEPFPLEPAGVDELDPVRHVPVTGPAPVFARLVRHPPVTAPWRAHLGFTADLAARAVRQDTLPASPPVAYLAGGRAYHPSDVWIVHDDPPVPYPALEEDTLTREFEPLELGPPLPEMTP